MPVLKANPESASAAPNPLLRVDPDLPGGKRAGHEPRQRPVHPRGPQISPGGELRPGHRFLFHPEWDSTVFPWVGCW